MIRKLIILTLCLSLGLAARAEATDISQYENVVYPVPTTGSAGSAVTVSVEMNNTVNATGFQFDIVLPEGITVATDGDGFYLIALSETRTTSKKTDFFSSALQADGSARVMCSSTQSYTFSGNEGEVCTIQLNIAPNVADGSYPIIFNNIEISDADAVAHRVSKVEGTLTVGSTQYDEGYSVSILPFLVTEDAEGGAGTFLVTNATALTNVEFDVELPSEFIENELYGIDRVLGSTKFTTTDDLIGNDIHVSVARKSSNTIAVGEDTELALLGIAYDNTKIAGGVHRILIKNIVLTDVDNNEYHAAPFTTYLIQDAYSRPMSNQWGTICLPYATQTTDDVKLYELSGVDISGGVMTFSPIETLNANTPAVFKTTAATATFPVTAADEADGMVVSAPSKADGWTVKGSYYDQELDPDGSSSDIYYIASNRFYYANQAFDVKAFRAWFETPKTAGSKAFVFSIDSEKPGTTSLNFVENTDGTIDTIYDINGRRLQQRGRGINIINGKKVMSNEK